MKYLLGIDFGTTTTAISCTRISATFEPELIEIDNQRTTESVVRLTDGNEIEIVGIKAWEDMADAPERTFYEFKLKVASKDPLQLPDGPGTARDVGVIFLRNLREKIECGLFGNSPLKEIDSNEGLKTVIGHPSGWSEAQRKATVSMAEEAGFPNVEGCEEPIGALYYHYHLGDLSLDKTQKLLVYDFGGGTSDVAIIATSGEEEPKIVATSGIGDLGGRNFDERIASAWEEKLLRETQKSDLSNRDRAMVRRHSRRLKEKLSIAVEGKGNSASETIPNLKCKGDSDTFSLDVATFESMNADSIDRFGEPLWDAMSGASLSPSDIDIVILTGGSGRFYFAREKLKQMFPKARILRSANPQEAVSKGLALYSKVLVCGRESIRKELEVDVQKDLKEPSEVTKENTPRMHSDPYAGGEARRKKTLFKLGFIGAIVVSALFFMFFLFNEQKPGLNSESTVVVAATNPEATPTSTASKQSKEDLNRGILLKIIKLYESLSSAQDDKNVSLITAIQSEVNRLDVGEAMPEVWQVKQSLSAWAQTAIDYHRRYGKHPNDVKSWALSTSKDTDAVYQEPLLGNFEAIDRWQISSDYNAFWYYFEKARAAVGWKVENSIIRYSINIKEFDIDAKIVRDQTNYNPWSERLTEGDPDVKLIIAWKLGDNFVPIKIYPRNQKSYEDTLKKLINERFVWYSDLKDRLSVFMIDIDVDKGELLDHNTLPNSNINKWFLLGSGCKVYFNIETDIVKPD